MSKIRFVDNDYSDFSTITVSSELAGFPATNAANSLRTKVWKPSGSFTVVFQVNQNLYIEDPTPKTVYLTAGTYATGTILAAHIQTQLNALSSGWTVTYSTTTYKFTISRSSSATLRFDTTLYAAWDMLGFTLGASTTGTSFPAQEQRNHTEERYQWSHGVALAPTFVGVIGPLGDTFTISETATVKLMGNNMPVWTAPAMSVTLDVRDRGTMSFLDSYTDPHLYHCLEIIDRTNPLGPNGIALGRIVLGDYVTMTNTNVSRGFGKKQVDSSEVTKSESGVKYYNRKVKYRAFSSLEIVNMSETERLDVEGVFERAGLDYSMFVSLDPTLLVSPTLDDLTMYCNFADDPELRHLFKDYYSVGFKLEEAI